ncbi:hypothetical protein BDW62DRAFT_40554 [Aspergillus aurantiobrunneus]
MIVHGPTLFFVDRHLLHRLHADYVRRMVQYAPRCPSAGFVLDPPSHDMTRCFLRGRTSEFRPTMTSCSGTSASTDPGMVWLLCWCGASGASSKPSYLRVC